MRMEIAVSACNHFQPDLEICLISTLVSYRAEKDVFQQRSLLNHLFKELESKCCVGTGLIASKVFFLS